MIGEIAEAIRCDRYMRMVKKEYSFILKDQLNGSFLDYFHDCCQYYGIKYICSYKHFKRFCNNECSFKDLSVSLCEKFSKFLFKERCWKRTGKLKHNTAVAYLNAFLSVVALAYKDGILQNDITADVKRIHWNHDTKKEYLEESEIQRLEKVDYSANPMVKQAALLSVYTGLRRADIINLEWKDINLRYKNKSNICLTIRKTKTVVSLPLSASATRLLRSISRDGPRVFPGLTEFMLNKEVPLLVEKAKIDKHITFHCFRHSFAMALLNKGTDIYTIAKLMGHRSVLVFRESQKWDSLLFISQKRDYQIRLSLRSYVKVMTDMYRYYYIFTCFQKEGITNTSFKCYNSSLIIIFPPSFPKISSPITLIDAGTYNTK